MTRGQGRVFVRRRCQGRFSNAQRQILLQDFAQSSTESISNCLLFKLSLPETKVCSETDPHYSSDRFSRDELERLRTFSNGLYFPNCLTDADENPVHEALLVKLLLTQVAVIVGAYGPERK